ncbi:MAG TPA: PilZ domain-containing protein [Methylomirabilota bacterium]|nr:PilZ domain-containing protein [Methylomirabilota bacterium]
MTATSPDFIQIIAQGAKRPAAPVAAAAAGSDRRTSPRLATTANDYVTFNSVRFPLRNWSASGLLFGPMGTPPGIGQKLTLNVTVMCGQDRLRFDAACEVVRVASNLVAARYACQSPEVAAKIRAYFEAHP